MSALVGWDRRADRASNDDARIGLRMMDSPHDWPSPTPGRETGNTGFLRVLPRRYSDNVLSVPRLARITRRNWVEWLSTAMRGMVASHNRRERAENPYFLDFSGHTGLVRQSAVGENFPPEKEGASLADTRTGPNGPVKGPRGPPRGGVLRWPLWKGLKHVRVPPGFGGVRDEPLALEAWARSHF
jgi:hypothetical protein